MTGGVVPGGAGGDDVIQLQHVRKDFGKFVAVHDANFSIARGEFFAMLGPSGCGKTTTLRMIAGFDLPTSGTVLLEGADVTRVPPYKRNVNTVFQQYALFPHMNIRDNVSFGLRSKGGIAESDVRRRVDEMLEIVRLSQFAARRPAQLSGGQQQRVALARALVNLPSALLLDEPLAALDLKLRQAMQIELKRIQREVGITFVFVTHDQEEALTMSDRIAVMSQGNVEQIGTPEEIYNSPSSIFVGGFIGSANLLPGQIESRDGDGFLVQLECGPRIHVSGPAGSPGETVTVMVRPERLTPSRVDPQTPNSVRGRITNIIFQGSETRLVQVLADRTELVMHVESGEEGIADIRVGDELYTSWSANAAYMLQGSSSVVGATTTDVDEVQAALDGKDASAAKPEVVKDEKPKINRRALLIGGGVVAAGAVGALFISSGTSGGSSSGGAGGTSGNSGGVGSGDKLVRILNWTAYIDPTEDGKIGTVDRFEKDTGIKAEYSENFNDNNEIFNKEFQAIIGNGGVMAYDIACPTYWMAARIRSLGWMDPIPYDLIPNYVNVDPQYLTVGWDPGGKYNMPWQAGITGIAYNKKLAGRELKSINDIFDPAFKGRVAMLTEMRDSVGLTMLGLGKDPSVLDEDGMQAALDKIQQATSSGQIRQFTGNEYLASLENNNFIACLAWSGDVVQLTNPDVEFVIPEEGGMSWYDTMVIPKGAPNGVAAAKWMNYVYDPAVAAKITAHVQYVSPVLGVRDELVKLGGDAAKLADSPILFPSEADKKRLHIFAQIPDAVDAKITDRFLKITGA